MKKIYIISFCILFFNLHATHINKHWKNVVIDPKGKSLFDAIHKEDIKKVKKLLNNKYDPNIIGNKYETALIEAINLNNLEIFLLLLEHNVDVNQTNSIGESPLTAAIFSDNQHKFVPLLLFAGAKINDDKDLLNNSEVIEYINDVIAYYSPILSEIIEKYNLPNKENNKEVLHEI